MPASLQRLLVVTRHSPFPENDGAGAYLFDLLSYLQARGTRIDVLWLQPDGACIRDGWWRVPADFARVARLHLPGAGALGRLRVFPRLWWLPRQARALHTLKRILSLFAPLRRRFGNRTRARGIPALPAAPAAWSALPNAAETAVFRQTLRRVRPDAVLANYCWLAPLLAHATGLRKLVLTHDVASHRLPLTGAARAHAGAALNPATPAGEAALLGRADAILAISGADAEVFQKMQPARTVLVVPKAAVARPRREAAPVPGRCLFVGGRNPPNEEGLRWFLANVWPLVSLARGGVQLHVCGAVGEAVASPAPNVVTRGRVANLLPEYAAAELVVVPLLKGTGVKIKLIEAAGCGKACVTTPVGLQGLPFLHDAVLVARDASTFAGQILRALGDATLRHALGDAALAAVERHLSPATCYGEVAHWLGRTPAAASFQPQPAPVAA